MGAEFSEFIPVGSSPDLGVARVHFATKTPSHLTGGSAILRGPSWRQLA